MGQKVCFTVVAEYDRLDFVSFHDRVNWDWPEKHQGKVKVEVRTPESYGIGGTRLDITHRWMRKGQIKTFIHLDKPIARGEEFTLSSIRSGRRSACRLCAGMGPTVFWCRSVKPRA